MEHDSNYMIMKPIKNGTAAAKKPNSELMYSELSFAEGSQNSKIHKSAEPETTYAQIEVKAQEAPQDSGSEAARGKDQNKQETAGGTDSKKLRSLGLVAILIIISLCAITIALIAYVVQLKWKLSESADRVSLLSISLNESLRNVTETQGRFQNVSATLTQTRERAVSLCDALRRCEEFHCPIGWILYQKKCYRFSTETPRDWEMAKGECESLNSHLAIINTQQEQDLIIQSSEFTELYYWIGLRDIGQNGSWTWVNGNPLNYTQWGSGEPSLPGVENCAELRRWGWNDAYCSMIRHYICEKPTPFCIEAADFEKYCP